MDDEKTRTIKRVEELAEALALERFKAAKATATPGSDLLMKVTGTTEADVLDHIRKEPFVWIAAILCYLEEWRYPQSAATPVQHETKEGQP